MPMVTVGVLFGLLGAAVLLLVLVLLRRRSSGTENADGLLVEQDRRIQAQQDRNSYSSVAVHNTAPTLRDQYRGH